MYCYCRTYSYTEVLVSTTKLILVLRILYLYYEVYPGLTELYWYFGAHTGISDLICVLHNLYMYFRSHTCITELILVLRNLYLSYGSYPCAKVPVGTISRN